VRIAEDKSINVVMAWQQSWVWGEQVSRWRLGGASRSWQQKLNQAWGGDQSLRIGALLCRSSRLFWRALRREHYHGCALGGRRNHHQAVALHASRAPHVCIINMRAYRLSLAHNALDKSRGRLAHALLGWRTRRKAPAGNNNRRRNRNKHRAMPRRMRHIVLLGRRRVTRACARIHAVVPP